MSPKIISVFYVFVQADPSFCLSVTKNSILETGMEESFQKALFSLRSLIFFLFPLYSVPQKKLWKPNLINNQGWIRCTNGL